MYVLEDAALAIERMCAEGRRVLIHCVQARRRTPTVAAIYGMRLRGVPADRALADVAAALPGARPIERFRSLLQGFERRH